MSYTISLMDQRTFSAQPPSHRRIYIAAGAFVLFLMLITVRLSGCEPDRGPLPEGLQTVRGVLEQVDISLSRSGTHRLIVGNKPMYYVESSTVNLRLHEGREAEFQGTLEHNIDPRALPVLVVTNVIGGAAEEARTWTIPALQMSIAVPRRYRAIIEGSVATFTASGSVKPLLTIRPQPAASLPFDFRTVKANSGSGLRIAPLVIANRKAVSVLQEQKRLFAVYVDLVQQGSSSSAGAARDIIGLTFMLDAQGTLDRQMADAVKVVQTLRFTNAGSSSSRRPVVPASSGSLSSDGADKPCGGAAGILCPSGYYCSITDRENDIGECTPVR